MKCLSVREPWASAIPRLGRLGKDVENRSWRTTYRGPLLIHAGKATPTVGEWAVFDRVRRWAGVPRDDTALVVMELAILRGETLGRVLGRVDLVDVVRDSGSPWAAHGQYHWVLANPVVFEGPVAVSGRLGLFDVQGLEDILP